MPQVDAISLAALEQDVHRALRLWHKDKADANPLGYLYLLQQAHHEESDNTHQTTNKILHNALEVLAVDYPEDADLLSKRYRDDMRMRDVANQLNIAESTANRKQRKAICRLAETLHALEYRARKDRQVVLERRLEPSTYVELIGVEDYLNALLDLLTSPEPPWLISIEGIGGLGKTSLADAASRRIISQGLLDDFGWVSVRQQNFNPGGGIEPISKPALASEDLIEKLVTQLIEGDPLPDSFSISKALAILQSRLKQSPHLIVIDNLETVVDIETLLPTLRRLAGPTKFLLTSRESLHHESGIFHFKLPGLSESNALRLIRYEARLHNLPYLEKVDDDDLRKIFAIVGGNPLALRLVVGQMHTHALDVILSDLAEARGQKIEMLYTFIYRRVWDLLDEFTRGVFLAMPLVTDRGGNLEYLSKIGDFDPGDLRDALDRLVRLNLVDSKGDLIERRYTIHNLTRTFLQEQVARWQ